MSVEDWEGSGVGPQKHKNIGGAEGWVLPLEESGGRVRKARTSFLLQAESTVLSAASRIRFFFVKVRTKKCVNRIVFGFCGNSRTQSATYIIVSLRDSHKKRCTRLAAKKNTRVTPDPCPSITPCGPDFVKRADRTKIPGHQKRTNRPEDAKTCPQPPPLQSLAKGVKGGRRGGGTRREDRL